MGGWMCGRVGVKIDGWEEGCKNEWMEKYIEERTVRHGGATDE
jgi:hypothetical protein